VVSDLYLGDPGRALTALSRYQELTGEEKPVSGWIAELRQRLGLPSIKRPEATQPAPASAPEAAPAAAPAAAPDGAAPKAPVSPPPPPGAVAADPAPAHPGAGG